MLTLSPAALAARPRPRRTLGLRRALLGTLALARLVLVMALMLLALSLLGLFTRLRRPSPHLALAAGRAHASRWTKPGPPR